MASICMSEGTSVLSDLEAFVNTKVHHARNRCKGNGSFSTVISPEEFDRAIGEITSWEGYEPTPLVTLNDLAASIDLGAIYYKDESQRFGLGSFKALGAAYATQSLLARVIGKAVGHPVKLFEIRFRKYAQEAANVTVACATAGNHGRSLAWGARRFGCKCVIYVHSAVSLVRQKAMEDLGAIVVRVPGNYDNALNVLKRDAQTNGWLIVSDASWDDYVDAPTEVMAGYGIMTDEVLRQLSSPLTHIFLQCGVGSLSASVAAFIGQRLVHAKPRVVVVEPTIANCAFQSISAGCNTKIDIEQESIMAGLSCGRLSDLAWTVLSEEASDFLTIEEDLIAPTMNMLANPSGSDGRIVAGESAVAGLAAFIALGRKPELAKVLGLKKSSKSLFIGTEGATDPSIYSRLLGGGK